MGHYSENFEMSASKKIDRHQWINPLFARGWRQPFEVSASGEIVLMRLYCVLFSVKNVSH
jgi:hypothetical protein